MAFASGIQSTFQHASDPLTSGSPESPRAQILRESREFARSSRQKERPRYFNEPRHPGTAAFNLKTGFSELPRTRRRGRHTARQTSTHAPTNNVVPDIIVEAANWTPEEHNDRMMQEFEVLEQASRSNSPTQLSCHSDSNFNFSSSSSLVQEPACTWTMPQPPFTFHSDQYAYPESPAADQGRPATNSPGLKHWAEATVTSFEGTHPSIVLQPSTPALLPDVRYLTSSDTHSITEQQLIIEVKDIYAGLVMLEKDCREVTVHKARSSEQPKHQKWLDLVAQHRTLLQEHHDFYSASQHPVASYALKRLAIKYAMPARMWKFGIQPALQLFRSLPAEVEHSTSEYVELVYAMLESLQRDFPQDAREWDLVKYNLCEYFLALKKDGVGIPSSVIDRWTDTYSSVDWQRHEEYGPMSGRFFGDDESFYWYTQENLLGPSLPRQTPDRFDPRQEICSKESALRFMSGWLHYGRQIATSFHAFTNTFIFLSFVGAAMPLFNSAHSA